MSHDAWNDDAIEPPCVDDDGDVVATVRGSDGDGDMPIIDDDVIGVIARCDEREGDA